MITSEQLSSICVQCGMCCDGTLFNNAKIYDDADERIATQLGLTVSKKENQQLTFLLPCPCFKTCCTVYEKKRPQICGNYFCAPLRKASKGIIDIEEANKIIQTTLTLRAEVRTLASSIEVFKHYSIQELCKEIQPQPSETLKQHPNLLIKIAALTILLTKIKEFKKTNF